MPALRMPDVFLELAEEARNSGRLDDQSTDMKDVQPQRNGQTRPVLVTEIMDSTPVLGNSAFRVTNTSDETIPDRSLDEPVDRSNPVGPTQWNGTVCLPQIRCRPGGAHSH